MKNNIIALSGITALGTIIVIIGFLIVRPVLALVEATSSLVIP